MNNDNNINSLEEQRRRKADNFRLRIQDDYDDEGESGYSDEPEEISSYSGEDVKDQIARESKRSLKRKMKEEKRELRARNRRNRRIFRIAWLVSVAIVGAAIAMFLFAYTTALGWCHYGAKAVEHLLGVKAVLPYRIIFVIMVLSGCLMSFGLALDISDTFNGLMMIPNLIGVLALFPLVVKITKNYVDRKIRKKDVAPMLSFDPQTQAEMEKELAKEEGKGGFKPSRRTVIASVGALAGLAAVVAFFKRDRR